MNSSVLLIIYFIKMSVKIKNAVLDMKQIKTKICNIIAHAVIKTMNISLIKNHGGRELCHNVLFSKDNIHKDGTLLLIINFM